VNAISPGFIKSPMHGEETHEALGSLHLGGHMGEMSDVAQAIVHLDFAGFVTGEILHVDGGQSTGYLDLLFQTPETTKPSHFCEGFVLYGAGTRSRTRDLLITSQLLYQLSYTGVLGDDYSDWLGSVNP
jgi:hypothetical protein